MLKKLFVALAAVSVLSLTACKTVDLNEYDEGTIGTGTGTETNTGGTTTGTLGPVDSISRTVYFDYDSYTVKDEYRPAVSGNANYLREAPNAKVKLEGHTDARGSTEYNLALGQKRAEAVRQSLLLLGVKDAQIEAISYGKERPTNYGSGEEAWSKNRRVEFSYR